MTGFNQYILYILSCYIFQIHVKLELSKARKERRLVESDKTVDMRHPKMERFDKEKTKFQKQGKSKQEEIKQGQFKVLNGENQQEEAREMKMDWNGIEKSNNRIDRMEKRRSLAKKNKNTTLISRRRSLKSQNGKSQNISTS